MRANSEYIKVRDFFAKYGIKHTLSNASSCTYIDSLRCVCKDAINGHKQITDSLFWVTIFMKGPN